MTRSKDEMFFVGFASKFEFCSQLYSWMNPTISIFARREAQNTLTMSKSRKAIRNFTKSPNLFNETTSKFERCTLCAENEAGRKKLLISKKKQIKKYQMYASFLASTEYSAYLVQKTCQVRYVRCVVFV